MSIIEFEKRYCIIALTDTKHSNEDESRFIVVVEKSKIKHRPIACCATSYQKEI